MYMYERIHRKVWEESLIRRSLTKAKGRMRSKVEKRRKKMKNLHWLKSQSMVGLKLVTCPNYFQKWLLLVKI